MGSIPVVLFCCFVLLRKKKKKKKKNMPICCIGGVCVPWEILPLLALCLKFVVDKLAQAGLLPEAWAKKLGVHVAGVTCANKGSDCCKDAGDCCNDAGDCCNDAGDCCNDGSCDVPDTEPAEMPHITDEKDWEDLLKKNAKGFVVAKMTASWCRPCKAVQPAFGRLAGKYADAAAFCTVDVDECDEVASSFNVSMMPTFVIVNVADRTVLERFAGSDERQLAGFLSENLTKLTKKKERAQKTWSCEPATSN